MKNKTINRVAPELKNVDKVISELFSSSYMNNTKWKKLIENLTGKFNQIFVNYKLVYSDLVKGFLFDNADFEPFFIEPILYKEIEWIEIPNSYEDWINENNRKSGKKHYLQTLSEIRNEINKIGQFEMDFDDQKIKIYAYK